jgi:uncharacterized protein YbbC (DUF1343 family)
MYISVVPFQIQQPFGDIDMRSRTVLLCLFLAAVLPALAKEPSVKTGIEVLRSRGFDILRGKRVGLITNPTGVDSRLQSTIDILAHAPGVTLAALYGPEHGVRGNVAAGMKVEASADPKTGVPLFSLYGKTMKPTAEMLKNVDVLVYDIQDIGVRSYTYISTMGLCMEAAAENNIPFVVLDRPDPLGGIRLEGALVEKGFESFVSRYPIPYVYGATPGELARYLNGEHLLNAAASCSLTVVPMSGWKRSMTFEQTGLPWVPTSPHVPDADSPLYYVATGIMGELGSFSEGVGFPLPFKLFGATWIDEQAFADTMNAKNLKGIIFRPITYRPFYGHDAGKDLHGVQLHILDPAAVNLVSIQFLLMEAHHAMYPDRPIFGADSGRTAMFDKVVGTDAIRKAFQRRYLWEDVRWLMQKPLQEFRERFKRYALYK